MIFFLIRQINKITEKSSCDLKTQIEIIEIIVLKISDCPFLFEALKQNKPYKETLSYPVHNSGAWSKVFKCSACLKCKQKLFNLYHFLG